MIGDGQGLGTILNDDFPPPTTVDDAHSTPLNTPLHVAAPGVLANDNSNGGGAMTASLVSNVSSGVLTLAANGGFAYTPNAGFAGTDTFTYRAGDILWERQRGHGHDYRRAGAAANDGERCVSDAVQHAADTLRRRACWPMTTPTVAGR